MVRSVETIRKEIKALEETTTTLAAEFDRLYGSYLEVLGQAIRRQVVIATYHLCTQVYPEAFLGLSVNQREQLQKQIRQLGQEGQTWLKQLMEAPNPEPQAFEDLPADQQERISRLTAALETLPMDEDESDGKESEPDGGPETQDEVSNLQPEGLSNDPETPFNPGEAEDEPGEPEEGTPGGGPAPVLSRRTMDPKSLIQSVIMAAMADDMQETLTGRPFSGDSLTPTLLAKHHLILEQRIRQILHRVSKKANHHLKQAQVIPDLPEAVLDAAAEAETGPEKGRSMPNLLNVLVEMASDMDNDSEEDESMDEDEDSMDDQDTMENEDGIQGMMTHLAAINLRLSDLEFSDVQSSLWRSKLRTALGRLRKLGKQYQRTQREMAIAEAEQAWRAVWYDDSSE